MTSNRTQATRFLEELASRFGGDLGFALRFLDLKSAFNTTQVELGWELREEIAPSMVVELDLVGGVKDFQNTVNRIEGFEFLSK